MNFLCNGLERTFYCIGRAKIILKTSRFGPPKSRRPRDFILYYKARHIVANKSYF